MKDRIDGNNRGKDRSIEELRYEMFLPHLKGKIKIPMEQYLELQKELGKINIFLKKSLEVMKKTETTVTEKDGFRCYYKESWFEHQVVSVERERRLTAILETSFLPKENRFSKYIQGFNEIKNQILSLGCNDTNEKTSLLFQQAEYRESKYPQKFKS